MPKYRLLLLIKYFIILIKNFEIEKIFSEYFYEPTFRAFLENLRLKFDASVIKFLLVSLQLIKKGTGVTGQIFWTIEVLSRKIYRREKSVLRTVRYVDIFCVKTSSIEK